MAKVGFYVLPKGSAAGARGKKVGEIAFTNEKEQKTFVHGVSTLTQTHVAELFMHGGSSMSKQETAELLAAVKRAMTSSSDSTLSSAMSAEVLELSRGNLEGKLEQFSEILQLAAREGGLLTTLPE